MEVRYAATGERLTHEEDGLTGLSSLKRAGQLMSEDLLDMEGVAEEELSEEEDGVTVTEGSQQSEWWTFPRLWTVVYLQSLIVDSDGRNSS